MKPTSATGEKVLDEGRDAQGVEGDPERTGVDRDADLKDFFGSLDHEKLLTLVAQRIADGRVLRLIRSCSRREAMAGAALPNRAGDSAGRGHLTRAQQYSPDAV